MSVFAPVSSPQAHRCAQVLTSSRPQALAREGSWFSRLLGEPQFPWTHLRGAYRNLFAPSRNLILSSTTPSASSLPSRKTSRQMHFSCNAARLCRFTYPVGTSLSPSGQWEY